MCLCNLVRPGFVADERSRIEFVFQDTLDGRTDPKLLFGYLRPCMWDIFAEQRLLVVCRSVYAVGIQLFGDLLETVSVKVKLCPHTRFAGQKNNLYNGKG